MKSITMWEGLLCNFGRIWGVKDRATGGGRSGERTQLTGLRMGAGVARTGSFRMSVGSEGEVLEEEEGPSFAEMAEEGRNKASEWLRR